MSASFVTAWEAREVARKIEHDGLIAALLGEPDFPDDPDEVPSYAEPQVHIVAVIVEALRLFADTKEKQRALRNDLLPEEVA